jgi:hypothetical protein
VYGYRVGEVPLAQIAPVKDSAKVVKCDASRPHVRPVVQASLGCPVPGVALPHACPEDTDTMLAGIAKRFAFKPPTPDEQLLADLRSFVRDWIKTNLTPLSPEEDTSVESWLDSTSYPEWRRKELYEKYLRVPDVDVDKKYYKCKSFMKDETYSEYKHARAINSRSDEFKCAVGPIFKLIEKQVFKNEAFIKKIPVDQRPQYIIDRLYAPGARYSATDYTSFESLFTQQLMECVEFELYEYMTQHLPTGSQFMDRVRRVLGGKNFCTFKNISIQLDATRMSGEMCTSLGNGFSNLMFLLFVCERKNLSCAAVVEGDDALARILGNGQPEQEDFARLGLNIKLEMHDNLNEASFCGLVFDMEDRRNVTDPREVMAAFGWTTRQYAKSNFNKKKMLLRSKALSLAYQYPGCPILSSMARYGLRVTRSVDIRHHVNNIRNTYEREWLQEAMKHPVLTVEVGRGTRLLVERLYGIPVELQIKIESWFDTLDKIQPLDHPLIDLVMKPLWKEYYASYSTTTFDETPVQQWHQCAEYKVLNPLRD